MRKLERSDWIARSLLTLAVLVPYGPLLSLRAIFVTDDRFTSDIWNGELPLRVLLGEVLARGELPAWTSMLGSGFPLGGITNDPITLGLFSLLRPDAALCVLVLFWVLLAAHTTYSLSRHLGATRAGGFLAGNAFAVSGYMVCQLKHLGIISTVVWLPLGFLLLHRGLSHASEDTVPAPARRVVWLALFGFVFGEQALGGFPQSAYICALAYGGWALYCALSAPYPAGTSPKTRLWPLMAAGGAVALGTAIGAVTLLPLHELGQLSDRGEGNTWEWATNLRYAPENVLTFLFPYVNGDVTDATYHPSVLSLFPEDYGYVGLLTFLLAIYGAIGLRRSKDARFFVGMTLIAYLLVLGPATPVFRVAFEIVPGLKLFRCPTRFLVVVELGLCVLAALGLSRMQERLGSWLARAHAERSLRLVVGGVCAMTALDLAIHQPRQNPMVIAQEWLDPPYTAQMVASDVGAPNDKRVFAPFRMEFHLAARRVAGGYSGDLWPFFKMRELIEPNANVLWGLPTADLYAGISPSHHIDVWGDHNRGPLLMYETLRPNWTRKQLDAKPVLRQLLRAYGVSHVVSQFPVPLLEPALPMPADDQHQVRVYRIEGSSRVRFVRSALRVADNAEAAKLMIEPTFDPDRVLTLHDAPASAALLPSAANDAAQGRAVLERSHDTDVVVRVTAPSAGYLLLADTHYPGWTASVDGRKAPLYRANLSVRAVPVPKGTHRVRFRFESRSLQLGLTISLAALCALVVVLAYAGMVARRRTSI